MKNKEIFEGVAPSKLRVANITYHQNDGGVNTITLKAGSKAWVVSVSRVTMPMGGKLNAKKSEVKA